jgi:hypothetical protein
MAGDLATEAGGCDPPRQVPERLIMDDDDNLPGSDSSAGSGRPDPGKTVLAINGVIAAVGGTYASTHSLAATQLDEGRPPACAAACGRCHRFTGTARP